MSAPGFTAEASFTQRRSYPARPSADPSERGVSPAQRDVLTGRADRRYVVDDSACPPGQRMAFVPGSTREKYCEVTRPVYDLARMEWIWQTSIIPCGWEFVPAHWECQLPTFKVVG